MGEGWLRTGLGLKEIFGIGQKKAQNGIIIKNKSTMISAGFRKRKHLVLFLRNGNSLKLEVQIDAKKKRKERPSRQREKRINSQPSRKIPAPVVTLHLYGGT